VSFSEDFDRCGGQLVRLVDSGLAVKEAASALGISRQRGYAILRRNSRRSKQTRTMSRFSQRFTKLTAEVAAGLIGLLVARRRRG
jgi:transposase